MSERINLPQSCGQVALHTPREVTPFPQRVVQKLPNSCSNVAEKLNPGSKIRPKVDPTWPLPAYMWPQSVNIGQVGPKLPNDVWHNSANVDRMWPSFGQNWPIRAMAGQHRPILVEFGPNLGSQSTCSATAEQLFGDCRTTLELDGFVGANVFQGNWQATFPPRFR